MSATAFQRRRREIAKRKAESQTVEYTYEQLNDMTIPQIKEILDLKEIEYKSSDNKRNLIAYLVEVPEEQPDGESSDVDGDDT